jgi:transcriptional regulator with XRE-family HTH domain
MIHPVVKALHEERLRRGVRRVDLSKAMGWGSSELIREYEEGLVEPKLSTLDSIAFLLGHELVAVKSAR